jgi:hypothetical protein
MAERSVDGVKIVARANVSIIELKTDHLVQMLGIDR